MKRSSRPLARTTPGHEHARLLHRAREQQQKGNLAAACKHLRKAIKINPRDMQGYHQLARIQQQAGKTEESIQTYKTGLRQVPDDIEALINLGMLLKRNGQLEVAISSYQQALAIRDDIPELHNNLGNAWLDQGRYHEAVTAYQRATQLKPGFAGAWHNLGRCYLQQEQPTQALGQLRQARKLQPDSWQILSDLADCLTQLALDEPDSTLQADLLACLGLQRIDGRALGRAACRYLRQQVFSDLIEQYSTKVFKPDVSDIQRFRHPVLLAVLQREPLCDRALENLLVSVRRHLLLTPALAEDAMDLVSALAEQCFLNEYLWESTPAEEEWISDLEFSLREETDKQPETQLALFACYKPLSIIIPHSQLAHDLSGRASESLARLLRQQILEPAEEAEFNRDIPVLTDIHNDVSQAVRHQYENNPYPRWRMIDQPEKVTLSEYLCRLFPYLRRRPPRFADTPAILCAGCGTGLQALRMARRIESARILAVDISRASLAYGMRQARLNGCTSIRFAQGDILQLDTSIGPFDCIECYGVLHHLAEPATGWRSLRRLLKPGGVMRIGLYSHTARGPIRQTRQYIRDNQLTPDIHGIQQVRRYIASLPASDPVHGLIHSPDFYTVSECRDLMFHVQEHQLDLENIAALLEQLELQFLGFEFDDFALLNRYRMEYPHDQDGLNLAHWHEFEERYPDSFASQYIFWVRAKI